MNYKSIFATTSAFFWILLVTSCTSDENELPPGIIPPDSMISVLADVHLAESKLLLNGRYINDEKLKATYIQFVLNKSNIDTGRFNQSFTYYTAHPDHFALMYDKVMAEISKRQAEKK